MTAVYAHLLLNHVPFLGLLVGLALYLAGLKSSSRTAHVIGLWILASTGLVAVPVALSGFASASALEGAEWLDPRATDRHRAAGLLSLAVLGILATLAVVALRSRRDRALPAPLRIVIALLGIAALVVVLWASKLGGALRHSELAQRVPEAGADSVDGRAEEDGPR